MKHFIKYTASLFFVCFSIATLISISSLYVLRSSSLYKPSFLVNDITNDKFDYIILGSSVGLTTLNTKVIDSLNSTSGLNISMDDTGMSSHYLMLKHFLAQGKKVDYCILAPSASSLMETTINFGDNDYRFLMYVDRDYVHDYYKNAAKNSEAARISYLTRWFPFMGLSYYNTELLYPSMYALTSLRKRNRFDEKGNYSYPSSTSTFKNKPTVTTRKVDFDNPYLKKIDALCKENNIQLIYYFAPIRSTLIEFSGEIFPVINDSQSIKDDTLFHDNIHVNNKGRKKISIKFADSFKKIINSTLAPGNKTE